MSEQQKAGAGDDAASRRQIAENYREQRTKELKRTAAAAIGSPVEAAARFQTVPSGAFAMSIPFVGMLLAATRTLGVAKPLRGLRMLALDDDSLYAVGSRRRGRVGHVLAEWPRESVRVSSIGSDGTDSAVTFEASGEPATFRLYCSSLRTNPWASELVRALGGQPPSPIDPTKVDYDPLDLPTV